MLPTDRLAGQANVRIVLPAENGAVVGQGIPAARFGALQGDEQRHGIKFNRRMQGKRQQ